MRYSAEIGLEFDLGLLNKPLRYYLVPPAIQANNYLLFDDETFKQIFR